MKISHWFISLCMLLPAASAGLAQQESTESLVRRIRPAIVSLDTYDVRKKRLGSGTGFFVDEQGRILTNYHVVRGASVIKGKTFSGKTYNLKVLRTNPPRDLALLVINDSGNEIFTPLPIRGRTPSQGTDVVVIGDPLGVKGVVTKGIVSAVRKLKFPNIPEQSYILFDASVAPGNSGGPVVNTAGAVLGVATGIVGAGVAQNLNLGVPGKDMLEFLVPFYSNAAESEPGSAPRQFNLARIYDDLNRYRKSEEFYAKAIELAPENAQYYRAMGILWLSRDDNYANFSQERQKQQKRMNYENAIYYLRLSVKKDQQNDKSLYNLAAAYSAAGKRDEFQNACKELKKRRQSKTLSEPEMSKSKVLCDW